MEKTYITANDLAIILDTHKSTVYYTMHPEKKEELALKKAKKENRPLGKNEHTLNEIDYEKCNNSILIDIDQFLTSHKTFKGFKFKGKSFLDRMTYKLNVDDFPEYLTTQQAIEISELSNYKIIKLRTVIECKTFENTNYPITAKGRIQYLYKKESLLEYMRNNDIPLNEKSKLRITKQFFSASEVQSYLIEHYSIKKSLSTIYRRILETKEIPAIRFGYMLKIPILEFKELDVNNIFL